MAEQLIDWLTLEYTETLPHDHKVPQRQAVLCCDDQASPTLYYTNTCNIKTQE